MRKKLFRAIVSFALVVLCTFSFSACKKDNDNDNKEATITSLSVTLNNASYTMSENTIKVTYGTKVALSENDFTVTANWSDETSTKLNLATETTSGFVFESNIPADEITPVGEYLLKFSHKDLTEKTEIKVIVEKANVDTSAVVWTYTAPFVYDGAPKTVKLTNIPRDVQIDYEGTATATDAGNYTAIAKLTYADTTNYNPIANIILNWKILPTTYEDVGTITVKENRNLKYTGLQQTVEFDYSGLSKNVKVVSATGISATEVGTYTATITLKYVGESKNYNSAKSLTANWTISKANLLVKANDKTITYGDDAANNGVTYSGFVNGENENVLTGTLSYAYGTYTAGSNAGNYQISVSGLSSENYNITFESGILIVGKAKLTVKANDSLIYLGSESKNQGVTATGFVLEDTIQNLGTVSYNFIEYTTSSPAGKYDIIPSGLNSTNYDITYENGKLIVEEVEIFASYVSLSGATQETSDFYALPENSFIISFRVYGKTTLLDYNFNVFADEFLSEEIDLNDLGSYSGTTTYFVIKLSETETLATIPQHINLNFIDNSGKSITVSNTAKDQSFNAGKSDSFAILFDGSTLVSVSSKIDNSDSIVLENEITTATYTLVISYNEQTYRFEKNILIMKSISVSDVVSETSEVKFSNSKSGETYDVDTVNNTIDLSTNYDATTIENFRSELNNFDLPIDKAYVVDKKEIVEINGEYFIRLTISDKTQAYALSSTTDYLLFRLLFDGRVDNVIDAKIYIGNGGNNTLVEDTSSPIELLINRTPYIIIGLKNTYAKISLRGSDGTELQTSHLSTYYLSKEGTYTLTITSTDGTNTATYTFVATVEERQDELLVEVVWNGETYTQIMDAKTNDYLGDFEMSNSVDPDNFVETMVLAKYLGPQETLPTTVTLNRFNIILDKGTYSDIISCNPITSKENVVLTIGIYNGMPCFGFKAEQEYMGETVTCLVIFYYSEEPKPDYPASIEIGERTYNFQLTFTAFKDFGDFTPENGIYSFSAVVDSKTAKNMQYVTLSLKRPFNDYSYMVLIGNAYQYYCENVESEMIENSKLIDSWLAEGVYAFRATEENELKVNIPITFVKGLAFIDIAYEGFIGYKPLGDSKPSFARLYIVEEGVGKIPTGNNEPTGPADLTNEEFSFTLGGDTVTKDDMISDFDGRCVYLRSRANNLDVTKNANEHGVILSSFTYSGDYVLMTPYYYEVDVTDEVIDDLDTTVRTETDPKTGEVRKYRGYYAYNELGVDGWMTISELNTRYGICAVITACKKGSSPDDPVIIYEIYIIFADSQPEDDEMEQPEEQVSVSIKIEGETLTFGMDDFVWDSKQRLFYVVLPDRFKYAKTNNLLRVLDCQILDAKGSLTDYVLRSSVRDKDKGILDNAILVFGEDGLEIHMYAYRDEKIEEGAAAYIEVCRKVVYPPEYTKNDKGNSIMIKEGYTDYSRYFQVAIVFDRTNEYPDNPTQNRTMFGVMIDEENTITSTYDEVKKTYTGGISFALNDAGDPEYFYGYLGSNFASKDATEITLPGLYVADINNVYDAFDTNNTITLTQGHAENVTLKVGEFKGKRCVAISMNGTINLYLFLEDEV